jgi:hypothetical protein
MSIVSEIIVDSWLEYAQVHLGDDVEVYQCEIVGTNGYHRAEAFYKNKHFAIQNGRVISRQHPGMRRYNVGNASQFKRALQANNHWTKIVPSFAIRAQVKAAFKENWEN